MNDIELYIHSREDDSLRELLFYLHDFILLQHPSMSSRLRYKIPFYDVLSWICYLNPLKKGGLELVFLHGQRISSHSEFLQSRERKMVSGIIYQNISDINEIILGEIIQEAIIIDELKKS